jgi:hypothetical protein
MSIKKRIKKVEKALNPTHRGIPPEDSVHVVYVGNFNFEQKIEDIRRRIFRKHNTLEGLKIYRTLVPEPDPLPDKFKIRGE